MSDSAARLLLKTALFLWPLALLQGLLVRWRLPAMRAAAGPWEGIISQRGTPIRLLIIGESTVAGVGAPTQKQALCGQLARRLAELTQRSVHWQAVGEIGLTATRAHARVIPQLGKQAVDVVVIALGVNDVVGFSSLRRWTNGLTCLLETLREQLGPVPVYLAPVPPVERLPALPQPLRSLMGLRARILDTAASRLAISLADVIHVSVPPALVTEELFCSDGVHPSPRGYGVCARCLAEAMVPLFSAAGSGFEFEQ